MTQTRQEVEAKLADAGRSISGRVSAIEGEMRLPRLLGSSFSGTDAENDSRITMLRVAGAVVGGYVAWRLARGLVKRRRRSSSVREWAGNLADEADRMVSAGLPLRDAVDQAARLNVQDLPGETGGGSSSLLAVLIGSALRTSLTAVLRGVLQSSLSDRSSGDG